MSSPLPKLALVCTPLNDSTLRMAKQMSVDEIVYYDMGRVPSESDLRNAKSLVESHGMKLGVVEGGPPMADIVSGGPLSQQQTEDYCEYIRVMGRVGVPVLCYNFMHWGCRVGRTSYEMVTRGSALTSGFKMSEWDDTPVGAVTAEELWPRLEQFLKTIVPVCIESNVVLAMHPDDPPLHSIRGLQRIMNSVESFERLLQLVPHPCNGICFDVSIFGLILKRDHPELTVPDLIRKFGPRLTFVHFRDVIGTVEDFIEVHHDDGLSDHPKVMQALHSIGFQGPLRPDHVPLVEGEEGHPCGDKAPGYYSGKASGYTMLGRLYATGYLRGLIQATCGSSK
eukprot:PhF_6_TR8622/c0_g1_i1/m.13450/K01686/uxuA; mannonate dehydratase